MQVLLVNDSSASTSELLAAAVQASGRGVLVGEHTFGKGEQTLIYLVPLCGMAPCRSAQLCITHCDSWGS